MNVWILTTGSSDVQLKPKNNWTNLYRTGRSQLKPDRGFSPFKLPDSDRLRVHARVIGVIYSQPQVSLDDLEFPLIDNFITKLKAQEIVIDKVILVLSDQSVFPETKRSQKHPYWQDTCTLQPILEKYLTEQWKDSSPNLEIKPLLLKAASEEEGLDNWDAVLKLVQKELTSPDLDFPQDITVYVSHQAGTPAISSAVQFCSLAKFGDRVRFLVSNENNLELTGFVESSSYLQGIKREQAKKLLENYDYAGLNELVGEYLSGNAKVFLEAAIQWNYAEFEQFRQYLNQENILTQYSLLGKQLEIYSDPNNWWWHAYEAAYLALIRLHQRNAVEAFFHSFRSVEGLISKWTEVTYPEHVDPNNDSPQVKVSILEELPNYLGNKKQEHLLSEFKEKQKLGLHSFPLYDLLRKGKADWKQKCNDLSVFTDQIAPKRNKLFHRLKGLEVSDVFQEWKVNDLEELEIRIRHYLNFISNQSFNSLKEASLMPKVHQELKEAIDKL